MIQLDNIGVFLPHGYLFQNVSLQIKKNDKIGLVGKNGAGKSTLLRVLAGKNIPSEGNIHQPKDVKVGFLTQDIPLDHELTIYQYLDRSNEELFNLKQQLNNLNEQLSTSSDYTSKSYLDLLDQLNEKNHRFSVLEGYTWDEQIASVLKGLGFIDQDLHRAMKTFSGGWKMRVELAKILINKPDLILLDEPTNHLDILSITWLENYLQKFEGAVIVISHDRLFLDNVTKRTIEISMGKVFDFPFPYSKYKEQREEDLERLKLAKKNQDKDIKHTEELINKFRAKKNKAAFAQSLIKKLDKTERIEVEDVQEGQIKIHFPLSIQPGKTVLELHDMGKSYGDKVLFKNVNISVGRGEKIALLGPNGVGKSTLFKRILGQVDGEGSVTYGHNTQLSYFAQDEADKLNQELTVFQTVDAIAKGEMRSNLRGLLGAFLFSGEDIDKKVKVLSGGEKTRLALCKLLLSPSNFIILDEPTNHLDIQSKAVLKNALIQYEGTFIVVSHDREFLDGLTNRIWEIDQQQLRIHHFGVYDYLKRKSQVDQEKPNQTESTDELKSEKVNSYLEQKEIKKQKQALQQQITKIEKKVESLELDLEALQLKLTEVDYSNVDLVQDLQNNYKSKQEELNHYMNEWEEFQLKFEMLS